MLLQPNVGRRQFVDVDPAVVNFSDVRRCGDGNFVEPVAAVHDERVLGAERDEHARKHFDEVIGVDAEHLALGECGVGQRAENVEDRPDAELATDRGDGTHRRMQFRREQE